MVFSISLSILKSREDAEDVVQDIFANKVPDLLRDNQGMGREEMGRYLAVSARNLAIDRYRRRRRFPQVELDPEAQGMGTQEAETAEIALQPLLDDLTPRYREVLTLKFLLELTWTEVAAKLGLSVAGARKRAESAKKVLGEKIAESEGEGGKP